MSTSGPSQQQNQNQAQSSTTGPWAPAVPALTNVLNAIQGYDPTASGSQNAAANYAVNAANTIPFQGPQVTGALNQLYGSTTAPQQSTLANAYSGLQGALGSNGQISGALSPYLASGYTNPMTAPGIGDSLQALNQQITGQVGGYAAAQGRPLGTNAASGEALARGLAQGEAPVLTNEYNALTGQQMNAAGMLGSNASTLYNAGSNTAGQSAQLAQIPLQNFLAAINATPAAATAVTTPAQTQLSAATQQQQLPLQNIQALLAPLLGVSSLGGTSSGTGSTSGTTTTSQPLINTLLSALALGVGAVKSDVRSKTDVRPVGMLNNSLPVYSFRYKSDPTRTHHIGLLAQEVEQVMPEAVVEDREGTKYVNYELATRPAANVMPA
jgi:hypothetical protein